MWCDVMWWYNVMWCDVMWWYNVMWCHIVVSRRIADPRDASVTGTCVPRVIACCSTCCVRSSESKCISFIRLVFMLTIKSYFILKKISYSKRLSILSVRCCLLRTSPKLPNHLLYTNCMLCNFSLNSNFCLIWFHFCLIRHSFCLIHNSDWMIAWP